MRKTYGHRDIAFGVVVHDNRLYVGTLNPLWSVAHKITKGVASWNRRFGHHFRHQEAPTPDYFWQSS